MARDTRMSGRLLALALLVSAAMVPATEAQAQPARPGSLLELLPLGMVTQQVGPGATYAVNVGSDGQPLALATPSGISGGLQVSSDGRYVVFSAITGAFTQIWVHDRLEGLSYLVSVNGAGNAGNGQCYQASISDAGRYIAFNSFASDLVAGTAAGCNMFLRDMQTGGTTCIGSGTTVGCWRPHVSGDGTAVAFRGDNAEGAFRLYRHTVATGVTQAIAALAGAANEDCPTLSDNGAVMAYESDLSIAVGGAVVVPSSGGDPTQLQQLPALSGDGQHVVFHRLSGESTGIPSPSWRQWRGVYLYDRGSGTVRHVSCDSLGQNIEIDGATGPEYSPAISQDGRYVAFTQESGAHTIYFRDMQAAGATVLATAAVHPSVSSDGRFVAYRECNSEQISVRDRLYSKLAAPTGLQVGAPVAEAAVRPAATWQFVVSWQDQSAYENAFQVHVRRAAIGTESWAPWEKLAQVGANVTQYRALGQAVGRYQVRVRAIHTADLRMSEWCLSDPFDLGDIPAAPTSLAATMTHSDSESADPTATLAVTWQDNSTNEIGFRLQRSHQPPGGAWGAWETVGDYEAEATTATVNVPFASGLYRLQVQALGPEGDSQWTQSAAFALTPPAPTNLRVVSGDPVAGGTAPLNLSWDYSNDHRHRFELQWRRIAAGATAWGDWEPHSDGIFANLRAWNATATFAEAAAYQFRLRAGKDEAVSAWCESNAIDFRPAAPDQLVAALIRTTSENDPAQATFAATWSDNSVDETGFRVEYRRQDTVAPAATWGAWLLLEECPAETDRLEFDLPLAPAEYQLRVCAYNTTGTSPWAASPTFTCELPAPTDVAARPDYSTSPTGTIPVVVSWAYPAAHVHPFEVQVRRFSRYYETWLAWEPEIAGLGVRERSLETSVDPTEHSAFQYRIRATSPQLNSPWAEAAPLDFTLQPPTNVAVTMVASSSVTDPAQGTLRVTWEDNSASEAGFEIEYMRLTTEVAAVGAQQVGTWLPAAVAGPDNTAAEFDLEITRNLHRVRVRAVNPAGRSDWDTCDAFALRPPAPTDVAAAVAGEAALDGSVPVRLTWQYPDTHRHPWLVYWRSRPEGEATWSAWELLEEFRGPDLRSHDTRVVFQDLAATYQWALGVRVTGPEIESERGESNTLQVTPPAAPAKVVTELAGSDSAVAEASATVRVTWEDRSDDEDSFWVEYRHLSETTPAPAAATWSEWVPVAQVAADTPEASFERPLAPGKMQVRVRASRLGVFSTWASSPSAVVQLPAPSSVTAAIAGEAALEGSVPVRLTWQYPETHRHAWVIYWRSRPEGEETWSDWELLEEFRGAGLRSHDTRVVFQDLAATYQWALVAWASGPQMESERGESGTLAITPPTAPGKVLTELVGSDSTIAEPSATVRVTWEDRSDNEEDFWIEYRHLPETAPAQVAWSDWVAVTQVPADSQEATFQRPLAPGKMQARVRASRLGVSSTWASSPSAVVQLPAPTAVTVAVTGPANEEGFVPFRLTWQYPDAHRHAWAIYWRSQAAGASTWSPWQFEESFDGAALRSHDSKRVFQDDAATYQCGLVAYAPDTTLQSERGEAPAVAPRPGVPTNLQATVVSSTSVGAEPGGTARVHITWEDTAAAETGFRLERRHRPSGGEWSAWTLVDTYAPDTSDVIQDWPLTPGDYELRVQATGAEVSSDWCVAIVFSLRPPAPTDVQADLTAALGADGQAAVTVSWAYSSDHQHSFELQWRHLPVGQGAWGAWTAHQTIAQADKRSTTSTADATIGDSYQYRLRVTSAAGASDWCESNVLVLPPPAPSQATITQQGVTAGGQLWLQVNWQDNARNEVAFRVEHRHMAPDAAAWSAWERCAALGADATRYNDQGCAPGTHQYRVRARNDAGNSQWATTASHRFAAPEGDRNPALYTSFAPGIHMLGLPFHPQDLDPPQIGCEAASWTRWRPGTSAGEAGRYVWWLHEPAGYASLVDAQSVPGKGFWASFAQQTDVGFRGEIPPPEQEYVIRIGADAGAAWAGGWVQIANPRLTTVPWIVSGPGALKVRRDGVEKTLAEARSAGWCEDLAWGYTDGQPYELVYDPTVAAVGRYDRMLPWRGFWFLAYGACELVVPPAAESAAAAALSRPAAVPAAGDWALRLMATSARKQPAQVVLGQAAVARQIPSPPPNPSGLRLDALQGDRRLGVDLRSSQQTLAWDLDLRTSGVAGSVRLSWPDLSALPARCRPLLTDATTGTRTYMRTSSGYVVEPQAGETSRRLQVTLATDSQCLLAVSSVMCSTARNGETQVRLCLTAPARVDVDIVNIGGRPVATVCRERDLAAGVSTLCFSGLGRSGSRLPHGRYLVRVSARSADGQQVSGLGTLQIGR